ncbi:PKD domain-containing protein [Candidatus Bipolaricaulota bacterium]|nr:PKD domain-containing protein [Candidatus Bipolaricaulota bacterium]
MRRRRWAVFGLLLAVVGLLTGCALFDKAPTANFTWTPSDPLARTDVQFTDMSTDTGGLFGGGGVVSWSWDFGDNDSSPSQNPKHEYEKGGTYTVKLTATDGSGNTTTVQRTITITPSLDGRWSGHMTDLGWNQVSIQLDLNHSASGGITGTMSRGNLTQVITSASFDPSSREVQITCMVFGQTLRGTLNAAEDRISGLWYDALAGWVGMDWSVSRQ